MRIQKTMQPDWNEPMLASELAEFLTSLPENIVVVLDKPTSNAPVNVRGVEYDSEKGTVEIS